MSEHTGPVPPYGVPIRDAIARGDLDEMRRLAESVRPALEELEAEIGKHVGARSVKPYGPPIWEALESDDLEHLKAVAGAARGALKGIHFQPVDKDSHDEVREALARLQEKIRELGG